MQFFGFNRSQFRIPHTIRTQIQKIALDDLEFAPVSNCFWKGFGVGCHGFEPRTRQLRINVHPHPAALRSTQQQER